MLVWLFFSAHQAMGASSARHSLRPLIEGQDVHEQTSRETRGEIADSHLAVVARSASDEATLFLLAALWIASRSLSSRAHSRDPLARNDVEGAARFLHLSRKRAR
jgi:hypothetical protein